MSVFAGLVSLDGQNKVHPEDVRTMLAAMAPVDGCPIDVIALPEQGIALGKLRHGPDADQAAGLDNPKVPKILMLGELYLDSPAKVTSYAAYILDRCRQLGSPNFAKGLNGAFAIVILDPASGSVIIATDHNNAIQVHYMVRDGLFYFASEVKGLMALPCLPCKLDLGMALMALTSNMLLNLRTFIADVQTMDAGSVWQIRDGQIRKHKLWSYALVDAPEDRGLPFYVGRAVELLRQAVQRRTRHGHPTVMMTGGVDSRTVVSFVDDPSLVHGITSTCIGEECRHPLGDVAIARRVAHQLGLSHSILRWYPGDVLAALQNSADSSDGSVGLLNEENVFGEVRRVGPSEYVITGDECCSTAAGAIDEVHVLECLDTRPVGEVPSLWPYLRADRIKLFLEETEMICCKRVEGLAGRPPNNQLDELEHAQRVCHFANSRRRMHTRHGLLVRQPLLDLDYLDFLRTVPWYHRLGRKVVREALRQFKPKTAAIPYARTREQVDLGLVIAQMDRGGETALAFLFDDNPLMEEIFDTAALRRLVKQLAASDPAPATYPPFSANLLIPRQARWWLAAFARKHLRMRAKTLVKPGAVLLSVAKVAATLRHLSRRCAKPTVQWTSRE
jgi:hypothetical protein